MRILELHCDRASYTPKEKAVQDADDLPKEEVGKQNVFENALVVFTTVEKGDNKTAVNKAAEAVRRHFTEVSAKTVLVYPYAHLSSNLAPPNEAKNILAELWMAVKTFCPSAHKSPFGWYKAFAVSCLGHPLSELAKTITSEEELGAAEKKALPGAKEIAVKAEKKPEIEDAVSQSLIQEAQMKSRFYVMTPDGKLEEADKFDYSKHGELKKFADYEIRKVRAYAQEPAHVKLMKGLQLVDYEPGSDSGNLRWYPKGRLMKKILERLVTQVCIDYGAMEVETPIMYDYEHPALKKYLNRFPARQYVVKSEDKEFFLRFSACFGQFLINHDMVISHKHLPLKTYELTKYSFRREQSGEVAGLKRLRAFTMPDMHTLCRDIEQARGEFERQFQLCLNWMKTMELDFETAFRIHTEFYEKNKGWYGGMVKKIGKPILVEMFDNRYAYFITKFEFNIVDTQAKGSALSTVQIDVENAETYDLAYVDENGAKQRPVILHASISGSTDRVIYALLEKEARKIEEGKTPMFPLWLSPTQARLIPLAERHLKKCEEILAELKESKVRADVDDRAETLQKRIRDAEKEWVPYIIVIGDKEAESGKLSARVRSTGKVEETNAAKIISEIGTVSNGIPFEPLPLPDHLTARPVI